MSQKNVTQCNIILIIHQEKLQQLELQCSMAIVFQWLAIFIGYNHIGSSLIVIRDVVLNVV